LVKCPYFTTNVIDYTQNVSKDYSAVDSFVIHVCVAGAYTLKCMGQEYAVKMGECLLLPKVINEVELVTENGFKVLESYIE
jgi:mannose-6-phosphate isomerase